MNSVNAGSVIQTTYASTYKRMNALVPFTHSSIEMPTNNNKMTDCWISQTKTYVFLFYALSWVTTLLRNPSRCSRLVCPCGQWSSCLHVFQHAAMHKVRQALFRQRIGSNWLGDAVHSSSGIRLVRFHSSLRTKGRAHFLSSTGKLPVLLPLSGKLDTTNLTLSHMCHYTSGESKQHWILLTCAPGKESSQSQNGSSPHVLGQRPPWSGVASSIP
jgi:hypothetical protein